MIELISQILKAGLQSNSRRDLTKHKRFLSHKKCSLLGNKVIYFYIRKALHLPFCCFIVYLVESILQMRTENISNAMAKCRTSVSATLEENIEVVCYPI